jgi:hypothetical protein
MTVEQMFFMQTQVVQAIMQTLATMQQAQEQPHPQPQMQIPQIEREMCPWAIYIFLVIRCSTHYNGLTTPHKSMSTGVCKGKLRNIRKVHFLAYCKSYCIEGTKN